MKTFFTYFILFLIYSFVGWAIEVVVTFNKDKKFVNRGFLLGPYCPIYGFSSIIMILYLSRYRNSFITVFLLAVVVCSIMEYLVSYLMEKLFKARWWDYSNRKFNINGRVCLENSIWFGLLGALLIYIVNPFLFNVIAMISDKVLIIVGSVLLVIFITDLIISLPLASLAALGQCGFERRLPVVHPLNWHLFHHHHRSRCKSGGRGAQQRHGQCRLLPWIGACRDSRCRQHGLRSGGHPPSDGLCGGQQ